jgi:hypothetical protein
MYMCTVNLTYSTEYHNAEAQLSFTVAIAVVAGRGLLAVRAPVLLVVVVVAVLLEVST